VYKFRNHRAKPLDIPSNKNEKPSYKSKRKTLVFFSFLLHGTGDTPHHLLILEIASQSQAIG
jgi:hypothetical protein